MTTIDAGGRTFADGVLSPLIEALRSAAPGVLIHVTGSDPNLGRDLDLWCRFTRNAIIDADEAADPRCWTIRCGALPETFDSDRPVGSRLWLYTNFDCNLHCDYCCVRSSPRAMRRALGLDRVQRIAAEASALRVGAIFVTGGEPFLLPDIAPIIAACAAAAPTTVLTNGMLFSGRRLAELRSLAPLGVTLQVSIDSPTPDLHDAHRGNGTWARAWSGVQTAQAKGFRIRIAATVSTDEEDAAFREFLDRHEVAEQDRVIRRVALRGAARAGVPIVRADLVPEVTITAAGVYWHPVGADDADFFVTDRIFPLASAFAAVGQAFANERQHTDRLAAIFNCA